MRIYSTEHIWASGRCKNAKMKRTTPGIPRWSPTRVLVWRLPAYLWESGRDPELSDIYGRTWKIGASSMYMKMGENVEEWEVVRGPS